MKNLIKKILNKMPNLSKSKIKFMITLFETLFCLTGRVNFCNLSRYCDYNEKTFRRNFKKTFDFLEFNRIIVEEIYNKNNDYIIAIDSSFIKKSGKKTAGLGKFWNGSESKVSKGLEISSVALVDVSNKNAYNLNVKQIILNKDDKEKNSINIFLEQLKKVKENQLQGKLSPVKYIIGDGFYTKKSFVDGVKDLSFETIGKLRKDANLKYLYIPKSNEKRKRGRPKLYDGKVNFQEIDKLDYVGNIEEIKLYEKIVYSVSLKRKIKLLYALKQEKKKNQYKLFYSTDVDLDSFIIYKYYSNRFQIEFLFRDGKQFTGLDNCQSRDKDKLDFHFNFSLSGLNLIKLYHFQSDENKNVLSVQSYKKGFSNQKFIDLILLKLANIPNFNKIKKICNELVNFGVINS